MYKHFFKRLTDIVLSGLGIIVLSIPMLVIALLIKIDSPGPVFFKQKRIAIHKKHFTILKFRSMPVDVPKDTPTHEFKDAHVISNFQKALRKLSLDELPQLFCIFIGTMSVVGPRPALWNQFDLVAERDKYGANDVKPGLTGWAQINGRDELSIEVKAKLDGEYTQQLNEGRFKGLWMDIRCFFGTFIAVFRSHGVVEGGTGALKEIKSEEIQAEEVKI